VVEHAARRLGPSVPGPGARLERVPVRRLQYQGARSKIRPFRDTFRTCMLALWYRYLSD